MKIYLEVEPQVEVHPDEEGNPYQELVDEIVWIIALDENGEGGLWRYSRAGMPLAYDIIENMNYTPEKEININEIEVPPYDLIRTIFKYEKR